MYASSLGTMFVVSSIYFFLASLIAASKYIIVNNTGLKPSPCGVPTLVSMFIDAEPDTKLGKYLTIITV